MSLFGLISDTHGLVHEDIAHLFAGVEAILHAGDVVGDHVLERLNAIAPVYAVAGNCDSPSFELPLNRVATLPFGRAGIAHGHLFSASKDVRIKQLVNEFEHERVRLILTGHSHLPLLEVRKNIFIINPGAACKPRFSIKPSVCLLQWHPETDLLDFEFKGFSW